MGVDFESELDRLYGVELDRFVEERKAVARSLREEGRRAEAARVEELRKPTLPAWTVNQLARRRRMDVDLLLDAAHRLATAQAGVVAGAADPARFGEARELQRTALRRLEDAAGEVLGERAAEATLRRVSETLRTAAASPEGRELLARGRLVAELEPTGFGVLAAFAPPTVARPAPKTEAPRGRSAAQKSSPPPEGVLDEALEGRKAEARAKREQAAGRREAISQAREALRTARERERRLADEARRAQGALRDAERARARAEQDFEDAEAARQAAASDVEAATRALDAQRTTG